MSAAPLAPPLAVRCRGLTKAYGAGEARVLALSGIDLDVREGELLMLVGPSGSGKTTLLSIMTAILAADAGDCEVFGQDLRALDARGRAKLRGAKIGFVFQAFNLLPALSALENVTVPLLLNGMRRLDAERRAARALELVGLGERLGSLPSQLSGGQQQRVAIARAIVHEPRLVVCDEPTSALDHATGEGVMETLREVARSPGRAVVVVTHDARIFKFADRIARMEDGAIRDVTAGGAA